jgi:Mn-dependent transcriptional regulator
VEVLQRLTRRQLEVLQLVETLPATRKGVSLEDIANSLSIKPPSALEHVRTLQFLGLVKRVSGKTRITVRGRACLDDYQRHHRIVENIFYRMKLPADEACRAAREIDMALSHDIVERLCSIQGHPKECPHGKPIPPCSGDE